MFDLDWTFIARVQIGRQKTVGVDKRLLENSCFEQSKVWQLLALSAIDGLHAPTVEGGLLAESRSNSVRRWRFLRIKLTSGRGGVDYEFNPFPE